MKKEILKQCFTCHNFLPKNKLHFRYDKRRTEPYGSCLKCINNRRKEHRIVKKCGIYDTDAGIKKRVKQRNLPNDLIEAQRLRLILLNRIKNNEHLIIDSNYMLCKVCNAKSEILLPITFTLFLNSIKSFTKIHKHDKA